MTKKEKALKQLQALNGGLKQANAELVNELETEKVNLDYASELLGRTTKQLNYSTDTINGLRQKLSMLDRSNENLERTRQITAEGLIIERDELLNRAARLNMRIRGLGFHV